MFATRTTDCVECNVASKENSYSCTQYITLIRHNHKVYRRVDEFLILASILRQIQPLKPSHPPQH